MNKRQKRCTETNLALFISYYYYDSIGEQFRTLILDEGWWWGIGLFRLRIPRIFLPYNAIIIWSFFISIIVWSSRNPQTRRYCCIISLYRRMCIWTHSVSIIERINGELRQGRRPIEMEIMNGFGISVSRKSLENIIED